MAKNEKNINEVDISDIHFAIDNLDNCPPWLRGNPDRRYKRFILTYSGCYAQRRLWSASFYLKTGLNGLPSAQPDVLNNWFSTKGFYTFTTDDKINEDEADSRFRVEFEKTWVEQFTRREQTRFRKEVMADCEGRCVVTGCVDILALDAAHIVPYRENRSFDRANGVILRTDIHRLFDARLIDIDPISGKIKCSNYLSESYRKYAGTSIDEKVFSRISRSLKARHRILGAH